MSGAEYDVFGALGRERHFAAAVEREAVVAQIGEEADDPRAVVAARLAEDRGAEAGEQGAQLFEDDRLVALDVAFDEVEPFERSEKRAAATHPGRELHRCGAVRVVHEVLTGTEIACRPC